MVVRVYVGVVCVCVYQFLFVVVLQNVLVLMMGLMAAELLVCKT